VISTPSLWGTCALYDLWLCEKLMTYVKRYTSTPHLWLQTPLSKLSENGDSSQRRGFRSNFYFKSFFYFHFKFHFKFRFKFRFMFRSITDGSLTYFHISLMDCETA
jgi:hypothetical protein